MHEKKENPSPLENRMKKILDMSKISELPLEKTLFKPSKELNHFPQSRRCLCSS